VFMENDRENIDRLLTQAGSVMHDQSEASIPAYRGAAIRNFTLKPGNDLPKYLYYIDGSAAGASRTTANLGFASGIGGNGLSVKPILRSENS
jgi:hypothetical protein